MGTKPNPQTTPPKPGRTHPNGLEHRSPNPSVTARAIAALWRPIPDSMAFAVGWKGVMAAMALDPSLGSHLLSHGVFARLPSRHEKSQATAGTGGLYHPQPQVQQQEKHQYPSSKTLKATKVTAASRDLLMSPTSLAPLGHPTTKEAQDFTPRLKHGTTKISICLRGHFPRWAWFPSRLLVQDSTKQETLQDQPVAKDMSSGCT